MFRANPQHTGIYDDNGITPIEDELWQFATGESILSSYLSGTM
jgi:hypothetical protein